MPTVKAAKPKLPPKKVVKRIPTEVVVAPGYVRRFRNHLGKLISITLPDMKFDICTRCRHWVRPSGCSPNSRCNCCLNNHKVTQVEMV